MDFIWVLWAISIESAYSVFGGPLFIPVKAAQWHVKQKWLNFPGLKIPGSDAASA